MVEFFRGPVTVSRVIPNLPGNGTINIQTDADLTIAFWNPAAGAFGVAEAIVAPGDEVSCAGTKAQLTVASANVTITRG